MSSPKRRIPLWRLAFRNARRNTRRTLLTVSAVMIAVAALTYGQAHVNGLLNNMLDTFARIQSGHVRIRKDGYTPRERFMPMHLNVQGVTDVLQAVRGAPGVRDALARIRTAVIVDGAGSNRAGLLLGVEIGQEEGFLNPIAMTVEGRPPMNGSPEVLIGREFAEKLAVTLGDTVTLLGQTAYRSLGGTRLVVTGLAESGMAYFDNTTLIAPIDQVQDMAYMSDAATEILVFASDPEQADSLAVTLQGQLDAMNADGFEALSWRDQSEIVRLVDTVAPIFGFILGLMLLMAGLIIVNTMLMTVMERTQEFGMQAALGMRRGNIVAMIVAEGIVIGVLGAVAGIVLGSGLGIVLEHTGIDVTAATRGIELPFQGVLYPDWKLSYAITAGLVGVATAAIAALYPAWRAVRLAPAEALRS
jgi:putative ABC transport system permease protein